MNTAKYGSALLIICAIILLAGIAGLFLRQQVGDFMHDKIGVDGIQAPARASAPDDQLLNTEVLNSPQLSALKRNVQVFSIDDICGNSVNSPKKCSPGNANPFLVK